MCIYSKKPFPANDLCYIIMAVLSIIAYPICLIKRLTWLDNRYFLGYYKYIKTMLKMIKIKPFQETLGISMCGPASLKIVLGCYGIEKSEKELAKLCRHNKNLGVDDEKIKKAAESLGFKVRIKNNSNFKDIESWLNKKVPVIVNWFTKGRQAYSESEVADGHYSVVAGLDEKHIYLQDPEIGKIRKLKRDDFMRVWFDFKGEYIKSNELIVRQIIAIFKYKQRR